MINIFITNLGKYNEGYLIGEWITLPIDPEELQEAFKRILINEEYEEYFITDYETDLPIDIGEYDNVFRLNELAEQLSELSKHEILKYKAILEAGFWSKNDDIIDRLDDYSLMEDIKTCTDYAGMLIDDDTNIPEFIKGYINYERYGSDMTSSLDGAFTEYGWIQRI